MKDICEATQLSGEEELEVSQKSSLTRPFLDQQRRIQKFVLCTLSTVPFPHKKKLEGCIGLVALGAEAEHTII